MEDGKREGERMDGGSTCSGGGIVVGGKMELCVVTKLFTERQGYSAYGSCSY